MGILFDKKSKYKQLAKRYKDLLSEREQELTDLIVENNERRHQLDAVTKERKADLEHLRSEVSRLLDENHRCNRDLERYAKDNASLKFELEEMSSCTERTRLELQHALSEKDRAIDRLTLEATERSAETQRLSK